MTAGPPPETIAGGILLLLAILGEVYTALGRRAVRAARSKHRTANEAHASIPEVVNGIDRIEETVEHVEDKIDDVRDSQHEIKETVAYLHADDLSSDPLARQRLGVDRDNDLLRGTPDSGVDD